MSLLAAGMWRNSGLEGKPWALLLRVRQSPPLNWPLRAVTQAHEESHQLPRQPQLSLPPAVLPDEPLV